MDLFEEWEERGAVMSLLALPTSPSFPPSLSLSLSLPFSRHKLTFLSLVFSLSVLLVCFLLPLVQTRTKTTQSKLSSAWTVSFFNLVPFPSLPESHALSLLPPVADRSYSLKPSASGDSNPVDLGSSVD